MPEKIKKQLVNLSTKNQKNLCLFEINMLQWVKSNSSTLYMKKEY